MVNRVNSFDDVLDRLDMPLMDIQDKDELWLFLDRELEGHGVGQQQVDSTWVRLQQLRQAAVASDLRVTRFFRRGQQVTTLRDFRGRFITEGGMRVTQHLEELEF